MVFEHQPLVVHPLKAPHVELVEQRDRARIPDVIQSEYIEAVPPLVGPDENRNGVATR